MRIKIVQRPSVEEADGIDLKRFVVGRDYEVGTRIAALMLAEGWATPLGEDEPALLLPFSGADSFAQPAGVKRNPPNLIREMYPAEADGPESGARGVERRRHPTKK